MKSIFDLDLSELNTILEKGTLPEGISLDGLENRQDFEKLFKHRLNPMFIIRTLIQERIKEEKKRKKEIPKPLPTPKPAPEPKLPPPPKPPRVPITYTHKYVSSDELKEERLRLKQIELELKKEKTNKQTWLFQQVWKALSRIEDKVDLLLAEQTYPATNRTNSLAVRFHEESKED